MLVATKRFWAAPKKECLRCQKNFACKVPSCPAVPGNARRRWRTTIVKNMLPVADSSSSEGHPRGPQGHPRRASHHWGQPPPSDEHQDPGNKNGLLFGALQGRFLLKHFFGASKKCLSRNRPCRAPKKCLSRNLPGRAPKKCLSRNRKPIQIDRVSPSVPIAPQNNNGDQF